MVEQFETMQKFSRMSVERVLTTQATELENLRGHCDGNRRVCEEVLCRRQGGSRAAFDRQGVGQGA